MRKTALILWFSGLAVCAAAKTKTPSAEECRKKHSEICVMNYEPSTCSASTVDGGKQKISPLKSHGGNSCSAKTNLRITACTKGINAARLQPSDIRCVLEDPKSDL